MQKKNWFCYYDNQIKCFGGTKKYFIKNLLLN